MLLVIVTFVAVYSKPYIWKVKKKKKKIQQNIKKSLSVHNSNNSILFNKEDILALITIRK